MPLHIDRVETEMEILPGPDTAPGGPGGLGGLVRGSPSFDPALRDQLRAVVMDILREHMRELERRGTL